MAEGTRYSNSELERMATKFGNGDIEVSENAATIIEGDTDTGTAVMSVRLPRTVIAASRPAASPRRAGSSTSEVLPEPGAPVRT